MRPKFAGILVLLVAVVGCDSVEIVSVGSVRLPYKREVSVKGEFTSEGFTCRTVSGPIRVSGTRSKEAILRVTVYEKIQGDVAVELKGGTIKLRSKGNHPVYLASMVAELPDKTSLTLNTISGDIHIQDISGQKIALETVSGRMLFENIGPETLDLSTVSGGITIKGADGIKEAVFDTVSGDIKLVGVKARGIYVKTVSGNLYLKGCTLGDIEYDTISGRIDLKGTTYQRKNVKSLSR
jgi:DUF4097 and DUF4098 domain-containing protein YvlB